MTDENNQDDIQEATENTSSPAGSEDDLAAAWETSIDEGASGNVLNQGNDEKLISKNELDSLLGISDDFGISVKSGLHKLLSSGNIYYERLPMLEVVFDRLVRILSTTLRNFTGENVEVSISSMTSIRFGDFLNNLSSPAMINIFRAQEWGDFALLTMDSPLIYSIIDVLLGGRKGNALMRMEGRSYTTIERKLIQRLTEILLRDLREAFEPLCDVNFTFDRLETNPSFAAIARPANAAILVTLSFEMEERGGKIDFLIPYATLEPIRALLLQTFMGEKFGQDSIWESHLAGQLWSTEFNLDAILGEATISLSELLNLKTGSQVVLNETPESKTFLRCGEYHLFSGTLGRKGTNIAIKIDEDHLNNGENSNDQHAH